MTKARLSSHHFRSRALSDSINDILIRPCMEFQCRLAADGRNGHGPSISKTIASRGSTSGRSLPEACIICLEAVTERAVAVPCNHLSFDFLCLVSWLQERPQCPLCKSVVSEVEYDWRSPTDFKTYHLPSTGQGLNNGATPQHSNRSDLGRNRPASSLQGDDSGSGCNLDPALEMRKKVYEERLFSLHVGANPISGHREFSPQSFAKSQELQNRARSFLRRELQVFRFLNASSAPRGGNREFLLQYIVAVLKAAAPKGADGAAEDLLCDYLGRANTRLLLHELEAWLRSPFTRLSDWDQHVQYPGSESC